MFETVHAQWIPTGRPAVAVAGLVALVSAATGGLVAVPVLPPLDPAVGLALPLALLFGPVAALGVVGGVVLAAAVQFSLSWLTLLDALYPFAVAYSGYRLWGVLPAVATGEDPTLRSIRGWTEFVAVAALAGVTAAAMFAWGSLVAWGGSFHAIVLRELSIAVVSTLVVGPAVIYPARAILDERTVGYGDRAALDTGSSTFRGCVLAPVLLVAVGSVVSLGLGLAQLIGAPLFVRNGFGDLVVLFDPAVVGDGGRRVLVVFGAAVLSLVAATYAPSNRNANRRSRTPSPEDA